MHGTHHGCAGVASRDSWVRVVEQSMDEPNTARDERLELSMHGAFHGCVSAGLRERLGESERFIENVENGFDLFSVVLCVLGFVRSSCA